MSDQNCNDNDIKIFTFTEDEMWDIASKIGKHPDRSWKPAKYYKDGLITYSIAPEVENLRPIIESKMNIITLLTGIQFQEENNHVDMSFASGIIRDKDGLAGQGGKKIIFDLGKIEQSKVGHGYSDEDFEKMLGTVVEHEIEHYLSIPHPTESRSQTIQQLAQYFSSSILQYHQKEYSYELQYPDRKETVHENNDMTSMGPLDIFLLQSAINNSMRDWEGKGIKRNLDYISYFDATQNIVYPVNGVITLDEFILDKEIAITAMPRKSSDGTNTGDIAIMTSRGFVVIPEILGKDSGEIRVQLDNGTIVSSGVITPANGEGITFSDIEKGLNSVINNSTDKLSQIERLKFEDSKDNDVFALTPYCNREILEDVNQPTLHSNASKLIDLFKQFLPFLP